MAFASGVRLGSTRPAALGPARPCFSFADAPCCAASAIRINFGAMNYGSTDLPPLYTAPVLVPPPAPRRSMPAAEAAPAFPWAAAYGAADEHDWEAEQGAAFTGGADEDGCSAAAAAVAVAAAAAPSVAAADAAGELGSLSGWAEFFAVVCGASTADEEQGKQQDALTFSQPKKAAPKAESEARAAAPPRDGPAYRTRSQTRRAVQACAPVAARTRSQTRCGAR
ncbi:hypothetical protein Rsub_11911 [Raphidocelis subcapitata]|uniref:Uncharacterized protein n=1 Tax=Raphidocelis subcapitata TaxID=307507 RepID=A0A2V0PJA3_9CHLO|nr:hypothetical protein Rsub_11911 [Raphidocelis subcapitata]|eukprot:GBF99102.1 hypothetical protein Rsub_11911 [Raphidocelis subcapitata]